MPAYFYVQNGEGGNEKWKPIPAFKLDTVADAMFVTVLAIDSPLPDTPTQEQIADAKYMGPLYFDLDDRESPASTAKHAIELIAKLVELDVRLEDIAIYATGGKGFHIMVPSGCFMVKPPKAGFVRLPAIYKEMAFSLSVTSLDFAVYTARRGRMFRQPNVRRQNGMYKVRLSLEELESIVEAEDGEALYREICSTARPGEAWNSAGGEVAAGLMALFDECRIKVGKKKTVTKKQVNLPASLPSFEAMLRGEGIKEGVGFQKLALQIAITAHAKNMSEEQLLAAAEGLIQNHASDGNRYNTPSKRRVELSRMWQYTADNVCYEYSPGAIVSLLSHQAPDLQGIEITAEEASEILAEGPVAEGAEYEHANLVLTRNGAFTLTENGPKQVTAVSFDNVSELVSTETAEVSVLRADVSVAGRKLGTKVFELDTFNSVSSLNRAVMRFGQSFSGSDVQARGLFMRMVEKARKSKRRVYTVGREGLDLLTIPFHDDERLHTPFPVWTDSNRVILPPWANEIGLNLVFVGFPDERGAYKTDLSASPALASLPQEQKDTLKEVLKSLLQCQKPSYLGKLVGWMISAVYRMWFHRVYGQFPLLHINGAAGAGKCFAKGTLVIMADGSYKAVEDVVVGDQLLGPDGTVRNVLSLGRGREEMFEISQKSCKPYTVNRSHILSLKGSEVKKRWLSTGIAPKPGEIVNITVDDYLKSSKSGQKNLKGWKPEAVQFPQETVIGLDGYFLGSWLGDGTSSKPQLCKSKHTRMYQWWVNYAQAHGWGVTHGNSGTCDTLYLTGGEVQQELRKLGIFGAKAITTAMRTSSIVFRQRLLAGLIDSDGTVNNSGYRVDTALEHIADGIAFVARSLGIRATVWTTHGTTGFSNGKVLTVHHVALSGNVAQLPTLDKVCAERKQIKDPLVFGIEVKSKGEGDYYGFTVDGDHLFLLDDFTVVHNTGMARLCANFHYYREEPKMVTPGSTAFAITQNAAGSSSIPLIIDEYKPHEMKPELHDRLKLLMRDAYNNRVTERGGGTRDSADYRSIHATNISAPICFIAEAIESEPALMERVVLLTLVKPPVIQAQKYFKHFQKAGLNRHLLGCIGQYLAAEAVNTFTLESFREKFDPIYDDARKQLMLQEDDDASKMSVEAYTAKASAKERTVFNYAVAKFGLVQLKEVLMKLYGPELDEFIEPMIAEAFSNVEELQQQTQPEWLKVLNTLTHMTRLQVDDPARLIKGTDYAIVQVDGENCLEIYARACYFKYRVYMKQGGLKPLYPSQSAFEHGLVTLPALVSKGVSHSLMAPGGSHTLSIEEMRQVGFIPPEG